MYFDDMTLFQSGSEGYHTFRIPSLLVTQAGTLLAFAEGRKHGRGDAGEIDMVMRRSEDGGRTWGPLSVIVTEPGMTCGNPCPVQDQDTGVIWMPFNKNLAEGDENLIIQGKAPRTVWLTESKDDGQTWAEPVEITQAVKKPEWTWHATGPGHGIQLRGPSGHGRLLIPCDHRVGVYLRPEARPVPFSRHDQRRSRCDLAHWRDRRDRYERVCGRRNRGWGRLHQCTQLRRRQASRCLAQL